MQTRKVKEIKANNIMFLPRIQSAHVSLTDIIMLLIRSFLFLIDFLSGSVIKIRNNLISFLLNW